MLCESYLPKIEELKLTYISFMIHEYYQYFMYHNCSTSLKIWNRSEPWVEAASAARELCNLDFVWFYLFRLARWSTDSRNWNIEIGTHWHIGIGIGIDFGIETGARCSNRRLGCWVVVLSENNTGVGCDVSVLFVYVRTCVLQTKQVDKTQQLRKPPD